MILLCMSVTVSFIYGYLNFNVRSILYFMKYRSSLFFFIQLSKTHSYLTDYSKSCSLMPGLYSAKDTQIESCSRESAPKTHCTFRFTCLKLKS